MTNFNYAVVHWFNYRKGLNAGFLKGFIDFASAKEYAYNCAQDDKADHQNEDPIITEDEITDENGPGKTGSPYYGKTIIGYCGESSNGYNSRFYCVVRYFDGVENEWDEFRDAENIDDGKWYPIYQY